MGRWVGAVIVNVLTHRIISAVATDFQNNITSFHKAQRAWGNAQVAGACPCASARTHDRGLCKFAHQPPLENVENGRDTGEILSNFMDLRAKFHSGIASEY